MNNYFDDSSLDISELSEKQIDDMLIEKLAKDGYFELDVISPTEDNFTNHEELVSNYKKLQQIISYFSMFEKHYRLKMSAKNERIRHLEELLEKKNTDSKKEVEDTDEEDEYIEPFYANIPAPLVVEDNDYFDDGSLDISELTEEQLGDMLHRKLMIPVQYIKLDVIVPEEDNYTNPEELLSNYKKLKKIISYYYIFEKKNLMKMSAKDEKIRQLEKLLEEKNTDSTKEEVEVVEPFYADYLRQGYKIIMPRQGAGSISAEDKEGNRTVIAKIDGGIDWRDNPPRTEHNVIEETPEHLIVAITEEYDDGSIGELKRYKIALEGENT